MRFKDYYAIMGVNKTATADEIKRAYRKLARKYHPDVSKEKNAEEQFKELGEAYEVLKDPQKRAEYDSLTKHWQAGQEFTPPPDWATESPFTGGGYTHVNEEDFSDFFSAIFGRAREAKSRYQQHHRYAQRGNNINSKISINLEEAVHGTTRTISLPITEIDKSGRLINKTKTLSVKIPAGVTQGQHIRLSGQGSPGLGNAPAGDLYLEIDLLPHQLFHVDGRDLYLTLPITPWEAALGATISIPTLDGKVDLKIPPNTQSDQKLRLKGKGLAGNFPGDLYVQIQIKTPPATSAQTRALYQQMAEKFSFNPREELFKS